MAILEGNLTPATIQSVLDLLISKNPASTWLISDGRDEKVIYFSTGGIRLYASDNRRISRLEDFLVHRKLVSKDQYQVAIDATQTNRRESLDEALERLGSLPRERFQEAISQLIYLELCDVITWENGIFEFYEGNPPPQIFDQNHPALFATMDVKALANRVKEWSHEWNLLKGKVYSERLRVKLLKPVDQCEPKDPSSPLRRFWRLIDGQLTLRELSIAASCDFPDAARAVRDGMKEGALRGSLVATKESSSPSEVLAEIEDLETALDRAINTILIHKRIAIGYEKIQEKDRASEHYHIVGNLEADAGRIAKAVENYRHAINLSPQNIPAHESLIRRLQDAGEDDKAMVEISELARKLFNFGFVERAYESLRGIIGKVTHLFDVRILFGDILLSMGRKNEAVKEYLAVANDKKQMGSSEGIEELYRKILSLDPVNREARTGLFGERRRRVGKWVVWMNRISALAAVGLILGWIALEASARTAWARSEKPIHQAISGRNFAEAFTQLREFGTRSFGTLFSSRLRAIEKNLFKNAFYRLEADLEQAFQLRRDGKFLEAQQILKSVMDAKLSEVQVERARESIREVQLVKTAAGDLCKSAEFFLNAGSYEDAFLFCRKVIEQYPEATQDLRVPFYIQSTPPGAAVKINGMLWGHTPLWIAVPFKANHEVRLEKPGFAPQVLPSLVTRRSPTVNITLQRN